MLLIADSGSTKTSWRLIKSETNIVSASTIGYSPQYISTEALQVDLEKSLLPQIAEYQSEVTNIYFYGTGCSTPRTKGIIHAGLQPVFPQAEIIIDHDLTAAAKALCGTKPGIACILGTGANSCAYDGEKIIDNVPSVGFVLGDEGSGGYMGRKLIRAYFYRELPQDLAHHFNETYHLTRDEMLRQVYKEPQPNRYLAQFSKFVHDHQAHPYFKVFIEQAFTDFFNSMVLKYKNVHQLPIHFIGSIAVHFKKQLSLVLEKHNLEMGQILQEPTEALVQYHIETGF